MLKLGRKNSIFEEEKEKLYPNGTLRLDILKSFGADLDTPTRENIIFVNKALIYQCGRHLALRDIFLRENDMHKNDQLFILMDGAYNPIRLMTSRELFIEFDTINILGIPVMVYTAVIPIAAITAIMLMLILFFTGKRKFIGRYGMKTIIQRAKERLF